MATTTIGHAVQAARGDALASALVSDLLDAGFPSPDLLELAADMLPTVPAWLHEGPAFRVEARAGVVQLVGQDLARSERSGSPRVGARRVRHAPKQLWSERELVHGRGPSRQRVTSWSPKSRANLVRTVAGSDWRPLLWAGVPVMVTLTYPGDWQTYAHNGKATKRHLERFKESFRKEFGTPRGLWKLEFQRRGAPHVHLLLALPSSITLNAFRGWVAWHWNRAVMLDDMQAAHGGAWWVVSDRVDHLRAGTGVDLREGLRCRDPKRIAVYFMKHSAKNKDGKEYQHTVPAVWSVEGAGPGRFWGVWGIDQPTAVRFVDPRTFAQLRRLLRRWAKANGRKIGRGGRMAGCFAVVNDGPGMLSAMARALAMLDERPGHTDSDRWVRSAYPGLCWLSEFDA